MLYLDLSQPYISVQKLPYKLIYNLSVVFNKNQKRNQAYMKQETDFLFGLFEKLSLRLNKPIDQMKTFYHILKDNWYDNEQALKQITDQQYSDMKIPGRLVHAIKEQLGLKTPETKREQPAVAQNQLKTKQIETPMNEYTMIQYANQLQSHLKTQYKQEPEQVGQIFQTLYKIIHNIIADPYQVKFRTLKKTNNMVQRVIVKNPSVAKFLYLFGFQQDNEKYYLHAPKTHQLIFIEEVILEKANQLKKDNFQPFLGDIKMPEKPIGEIQMGNNIEKKNQGSLQQQFSKQSLAEMKYVDALDKLLEFRQIIMSQPPKDRHIRIYHKRHETKSTNGLHEVNMQEEFEKSQDKIIQSYWAQIMNENRKGSTFQSKRKQEFEFLMRQQIHKETIIKVKLPNEFIIEARFGPLQKLKDVFKLVSSIVVGDIYLFHAPPVKRLDKQMQKSLFELDSVPMGSFYMGINGEWYIQNEYSKQIEK